MGLRFRPLRVFGKYSYGIYVYHGLIIAGAVSLFGGGSWYALNPLPSAIFCVAVVAVSLLVAMVSYELFEKWFLRLK